MLQELCCWVEVAEVAEAAVIAVVEVDVRLAEVVVLPALVVRLSALTELALAVAVPFVVVVRRGL